MNPGRLRLFFALWPEPDAAGATHAVARTLCAQSAARQVTEDRLHMTLQFLGSQPREALASIKAAADGITGQAFVLPLERCGYWKRAGAAWLAPTEAPPALLDLVVALRQALERNGFPAETRPFRPHVTIARKVRDVSTGPLDEALRWETRHFRLVHSVTRATGAEYSEIARWPLAG